MAREAQLRAASPGGPLFLQVLLLHFPPSLPANLSFNLLQVPPANELTMKERGDLRQQRGLQLKAWGI